MGRNVNLDVNSHMCKDIQKIRVQHVHQLNHLLQMSFQRTVRITINHLPESSRKQHILVDHRRYESW